MNNLTELPYAKWLESTLQKLVSKPVESICIMYKLKNGDVHLADFKCSTADKIVFAGFLQHDAMMDSLIANGYVQEDDTEDED